MTSSHFSAHPEIDGLTLFSTSPDLHQHELHEHQAYSVIMLTHGRKNFHHMGEDLIVKAGEIAVANPGQMHGCGPINNEQWAHRTWYINQALMTEIAHDLGIQSQVTLKYPVIRDAELFNLLIQAHKNCTQGELLDRQVIALEHLSALVKKHANPSKLTTTEYKLSARNRYEIYIEYLNARLSDRVELKDLASCTRVKRNQVIKDFRHVRGATPGKVFRQMRLNHAKQMLSKDFPLADVANSVGFSDQSHFTRCFRKAFGLTPNKFRALIQKNGGVFAL